MSNRSQNYCFWANWHTLCPLPTFIQRPSTFFCHLQKHFLLQGDGTLDVLDIWLFFDAFLGRAQFWVKTDCVKVEHRPPGAVCPLIFPLSCYPPSLTQSFLLPLYFAPNTCSSPLHSSELHLAPQWTILWTLPHCICTELPCAKLEAKCSVHSYASSTAMAFDRKHLKRCNKGEEKTV